MKISIIALLFAVGWADFACAQQASFDCRLARSPTEIAICSDAHLSELDRLGGTAFDVGKQRPGSHDLIANAQALLLARNACRSNKLCILDNQVEALRLYQRSNIAVVVPNWIPQFRAELAGLATSPVQAANPGDDHSGAALTLTGDDYWLVIASREDADQAIAVARQHSYYAKPFVVQSENGWYAVVQGPLNVKAGAGRALMDDLIKSQALPQDIYLTQGANWSKVIWKPSSPLPNEAAAPPVVTPVVATPSVAPVVATPAVTPIAAPPATPILAPSATPVAAADRKVALVIGNSDYKNAALANPAVDADLVSASLRKVGFDVTEVKNADFATFDESLNQFVAKEDHADIALFYFAGHGFAINGDDLRPRNYLMSTSADMRAKSDATLRRDGITIDDVINRISGPARVTLAFVDACRNDPFHRGAGDRGFERIGVSLSRQVYIGMSTQLGKTALDGDDGKGSPFAQAFAEKMTTPGRRIDDAFRALREEVSQITEGKQQPEVLQDDLREGALVLVKAQ